MDKKHLIVEQVHGCEGDCLVMDENRVAGPKPWGGGRVVKKWLLDRRQVQEIVKIFKRFLGEEPDDPWIPVEERLPYAEWDDHVAKFPDEDLEVLVMIKGAKRSTTLFFNDEGEFYAPDGDCGGTFYIVTHWMPMPNPPKEEGHA